ncbi:GntR family transcriptional regulator [Lactobacillus kefiranofaciens]|uniref:GntR family transcriptional regulator n=1 Tax=Lactobacillus kefiranofaciens TaxID=267818 RepID=UPI002468DAE5|nr:GntR family transcriptional regulator [Lactobacillus kefiranofaciens]MDH5100168.1 GntR family transcriptional regulator [Lactobacillus kefiranofaciens]
MARAKYLEVAEKLKKRITDNVYSKEEPLPDQEAFAQEFNVSRLTVKKAFDGLERQGLIYKQSGLGTFVAGDIPIKSPTDTPANPFTGLQNQLGKDKVKSDILHFSVEFSDPQMQNNLSLKRNEPIYNIVRLRNYDEKPLIIEHTFMPVKLVPDLDEKILHSSIYNYIHQKLHLKFGHAYRKIRAAKPDKYDIKYLDAKSDDPMLELEQIIWLTNGQPIEYSVSRNRYDTRDYVLLDNNRF